MTSGFVCSADDDKLDGGEADELDDEDEDDNDDELIMRELDREYPCPLSLLCKTVLEVFVFVDLVGTIIVFGALAA